VQKELLTGGSISHSAAENPGFTAQDSMDQSRRSLISPNQRRSALILSLKTGS